MRTSFVILNVGFYYRSVGVVWVSVLEVIDARIGFGVSVLMQMQFEIWGVDS